MTSKQRHTYCGLRLLVEDLPLDYAESLAHYMSPTNKVSVIRKLLKSLKECHTAIETATSLRALKRKLKDEKANYDTDRKPATTNRVLVRRGTGNVRTKSKA